MEADWEFEIGGDAPVIEAQWSGFVDLRLEPERAADLPEVIQLLGLAETLTRLNASHSPVFTCKTDVFIPERIDPDELDATSAEAAHALACYVDLLPRSDQQWKHALEVERFCRHLCDQLRASPLRCSRVDIVVRLAHINPGSHNPGSQDSSSEDLGLQYPGSHDLGLTVYATACGPRRSDARSRLAVCLSLCAGVLVPEP